MRSVLRAGNLASDWLHAGRRALWHLRHGGVAGLKEYRRRRRASAWARPVRRRRGCRSEVSFPQWPVPEPSSTTPRHDVTVGVIADEFTTLALQYEWRAVPLTPGQWREQVKDTPIDLLFVESAWHGNADAWRYQVIGPRGPSAHLQELVASLRSAGVPTVFWNKEDPAHYDEAIDTARLFNWVFTTDETLLDRYRHDLGHDHVAVLPFAAQPTIHNPVRLLDDDGRPVPLRDIAFAGMYFAHKYPDRRAQMDILLGAAVDAGPRMPTGLDIFSRYLGADLTYQFPAPFDAYVRGSLSYLQMLSAYRGYKTFLNVNSVVSSPSMFARRILEITACGTPVVTTPSAATDAFLPPGTLAVVESRKQAEQAQRALVASPALRDRMTYLSQREIWSHHTYSHRVDAVLTAIGMEQRTRRQLTIATLVSTIRPQRLPHILATLAAQKQVTQQPIVITHGFAPDPALTAHARDLGLSIDWIEAPASTTLGDNYNLMLDHVDADYIAKMDDDDLYSDHYLFEALAAADYAHAEVVGKHAHYMHLAAEDLTVLRFPDWEHRYSAFVSGPTIVARTDLARQVRFPSTTRGEDTGFLRRCTEAGARIYSASRFGFVQQRSTDPTHTWDVSSTEILATAAISHWGPPNQTEMPGS